jgi:hypothetical protein
VAFERLGDTEHLLQVLNVCGAARSVTLGPSGTNLGAGSWIAGPDLLGDATSASFRRHAVAAPAYGASLLAFTQPP